MLCVLLGTLSEPALAAFSLVPLSSRAPSAACVSNVVSFVFAHWRSCRASFLSMMRVECVSVVGDS